MKVGEDFFGKEKETQLGIWNLKVVALLFIFYFLLFGKKQKGNKLGEKEKAGEGKNWGKRRNVKNSAGRLAKVYCNNKGRCVKVFYLLQQGFGSNMSNSCIDFQSCCNKFCK